MAQAWLLREEQIRAFIKGLEEKVATLEALHGQRKVDHDLIRVLNYFLETKKRAHGKSGMSWLFLNNTLDELQEFTRGSEERDFIIGQILKWLVDSVVGELRETLTSALMNDPKTFLHAKSALSEVEL